MKVMMGCTLSQETVFVSTVKQHYIKFVNFREMILPKIFMILTAVTIVRSVITEVNLF